MLERYREETWFRLGDRDLATHIVRTARLKAGERLTEVCLGLQRGLGVAAKILPMSDDQVRTQVRTDDGWLEFQEYFVHRHQEPEVHEVRFDGADRAEATARVRGELGFAETIVIAPSNPIVSIGPILAVRGVRDLLAAARRGGTPVLAVSPIVGGKALKGPADRMLVEPRPRGVRARRGPPVRRDRRRVRARHGGCGPRAGGRSAEDADPRHRHRDDRRRVARAARPRVLAFGRTVRA